jgi:cytoskeletal protein CcmA (bactofilin family)
MGCMARTATFFILYTFLLLISTQLLSVAEAEARTVLRSGESVSVASDRVVEGDFYGLAGNVTVTGEVTEDAILIANQVTINGSVNTDVHALAATVDVFGAVGDDVRVVAGDVTVGESIAGDLVVIGNSLDVLSSATITGDVLFFGGQATIAGSVGGSVLGSMEQIRVDGPVQGNVSVTATQVTLGDGAAVAGDVRYTSALQVTRAADAQVAGEITRNEPEAAGNFNPRTSAIIFLVSLFSILLWYLLFGRSLDRIIVSSQSHWTRKSLIGLGLLIFLPPLALMAMITMIGGLVGAILLLWIGFIFLLSLLFAPAIVGATFVRLTGLSKRVTVLWSLVLGAVLVHLTLLVPNLGLLVVFLVVVLGVGTLAEETLRIVRGDRVTPAPSDKKPV